MGAMEFTTTAHGETAKEAFASARDEALYMEGHGGYTGSIAEKGDFHLVHDNPLPARDAHDLAQRLLDQDDERVTDKWGPAACIPIDDGSFLFFGWASS